MLLRKRLGWVRIGRRGKQSRGVSSHGAERERLAGLVRIGAHCNGGGWSGMVSHGRHVADRSGVESLGMARSGMELQVGPDTTT